MHRPENLASPEPYSLPAYHPVVGFIPAAFEAELQARQHAAVQTMVKQARAHHCSGRLQMAEQLYARVLEMGPDAEVLHSLGLLAYQQGQFEEAVARMKQAIALNRNVSSYHCNLGAALQGLGLLMDAASAYQRALALHPQCPIAHVNLGLVYKTERKLQAALTHCRLAAKFKPASAEIHMNLGSVLDELSRFDEALVCYERSLALQPRLAETHYNKGNALCALGRLAEAEASYRNAVTARPAYAKAHNNLGHVLRGQGRLDEALVSYREGSRLSPGEPDIRFGEATAQLLAGDFEHGWVGHEWRWDIPARTKDKPLYAQPTWDGGKLASGRLFIWAEQGVGDEIMFAGLVPDVVATGNPCILECDPRLQPLFARSFPAVNVIAARKQPTDLAALDISAQLAAGSLPRIFRSSSAAFAATASPFLFADEARRQQLRARYSDGRLLVGLAWDTSNRSTGPRRRIALSHLAPLMAGADARWISLQYGRPGKLQEEIDRSETPLHHDPGLDQLIDMDGFAAQVAALDLVITIDSSVAHLAGALGVPTWVLLPFAPDWRWQLGRIDSPWYPSMRLFRQPSSGDWQSVLEEVQRALALHIDLAAGTACKLGV